MGTIRFPRSAEARNPKSLGVYSEVSALGSVTPAPNGRGQFCWTHLLSAGALITGGALMVAGKRKAGLALASAGTAVALMEEQDAIAQWWRMLPEYLNQAQGFLDQVEEYLAEASVQGQRVQEIFRR